MVEINLKKLRKLKLPNETLNDTLERLIQSYVYPYDPTHGFPVTPYHLDYKQSLKHECNRRGISAPHSSRIREYFKSEKAYQKWLKTLEKIPKHLKGEI